MELDEAEEEVINSLFKTTKIPNFSFNCEKDVYPKSISFDGKPHDKSCIFYSSEYKKCADSARCSCSLIGYDMNKAFYTVSMMGYGFGGSHYKKNIDSIGSSNIPIFTATDDYKFSNSTSFPNENDWSSSYFFIKDEVMKKFHDYNSFLLTGRGSICLKKSDGTLYTQGQIAYMNGRYNNILTGIEFKYLINNKVLTREDIYAWKTASYVLPELKFQKWIEGLDTGGRDGAEGATTKRIFPLLNGLLGIMFTKPKSIKFVTSNDEDIELLKEIHNDVKISDIFNKDGKKEDPKLINVSMSKRKFKTLNTRNIYNHVIGKTNAYMMAFIDGVGADVRRIRIDSVIFDSVSTPNLPEWARDIFKPEMKPITPEWKHRYDNIDVNEINGEIEAEIKILIDKCVTYTGAPGTGKTTSIKRDYSYDVALAYSNICARNLDGKNKTGKDIMGETIHAGLGLYNMNKFHETIGRLRGKTLWIDELSTVQNWIWSTLYCLMRDGVNLLILSGDPNQIGPIGERFKNDSLLLSTLMKRANILKKDYRNDAALIKIREGIESINDGEILRKFMGALVDKKKIHKAEYNSLSNIDIHITFTNKMRCCINQHIIESRGLKYSRHEVKSISVRKYEKDTYWIASNGLRLKARKTIKAKGIYKGGIYKLLTEIGENTKEFEVKRIYLDKEDGGATIKLGIFNFSLFELGYAITGHSSIGQTIKNEIFCIHEVGIMAIDHKDLLYTVMTRGCNLRDYRIAINPLFTKKEIDNMWEKYNSSVGKILVETDVDDDNLLCEIEFNQ